VSYANVLHFLFFVRGWYDTVFYLYNVLELTEYYVSRNTCTHNLY